MIAAYYNLIRCPDRAMMFNFFASYTPEGVAMAAPAILPVTLRGLLRFRSPLEQFRVEPADDGRGALRFGFLDLAKDFNV